MCAGCCPSVLFISDAVVMVTHGTGVKVILTLLRWRLVSALMRGRTHTHVLNSACLGLSPCPMKPEPHLGLGQ